MHTSFQIATNMFTSWGCNLLSGILGWALVPIYLAELGKEGYGLIGLATTIITFTFVADMGLREALGRQLAVEVTHKDMDAFNELASSALVFYICSSSLLGLALGMTAPLLAGIFAVSPAYRPEAVFLIRWYAPLASVLTFIGTVFSATLTSANRFDQLNLTTSKVYALRAVILVVALKLAHVGLHGWAAVTLSTEVVRLVLLARAAKRHRPTLRLRLSFFRVRALKSLASLGLIYFGAQAARILGSQSDPFVLSFYFGPAILALYTPAVQLLNAVKPFVYALQDQLYPVTTGLHVANDEERMAQVLFLGTKYMMIMAAGVCAVLMGFSDSIIHVWIGGRLGPANAIVAGHALFILTVVELLIFASGTQWPVLLGKGRLKVYLATALPANAVYLLMSVVLVGHTRLGFYGVLVPDFLINLGIRAVLCQYTARLCSVRLWDYIVVSYVRPLAILGVLLLVCFGIKTVIQPASYASLALCFLMAFVAWVGLSWGIGFTREDRERLKRLLHRILSWIGGRRGEEVRDEGESAMPALKNE